jgi:Asp-tRNA(Asn)/Glu-tRNA(Gln) amidotransferase C subunit
VAELTAHEVSEIAHLARLHLVDDELGAHAGELSVRSSNTSMTIAGAVDTSSASHP